MMRALVISHACVANDNRAKWRSLARRSLASVDLLLPHHWPSWEQDYRPQPVREENFNVRVSHVLRAGREDQYVFAPGLYVGLETGHDILHVEQGSTAFVCAQALWERNRVSPRTKSCIFTWINWETSLRWPWRKAEAFNLRHSQGAIGGNSEAVDLLRKHGFRGKAEVIPQLGVDPEEYSPEPSDPAARARIGLEGVVIGFVGRLVEEKGIRLLLDAAKRLKERVTLLILGAGPLKGELDAFPKNGPVTCIHMPAVPHHEVARYLRLMDLLVLPSYAIPTWKEQFGHVLIEAMACGVPVVGSSSAAIPEVIGEAGLIFAEKNTEELHDRLRTLVTSESERRKWGELGRCRVLERYTHEHVAQQTLEFWRVL